MRRALAVLFLLCPPVGAEPLLESGRIDIGLPARKTPAGIVMSGIESLPIPVRYELFTLHQAYIETVNQRRAEHWRRGLLSGEIIDHPEEALLPVRQLQESVAKRLAEVAALEAQVAQEKAAAPPPAPPAADRVDWTEAPAPPKPQPTALELALKAKRKELRAFQRKLGRSKGLALDWSDAVWADLQKVGVEHWSVTDQARAAGPLHTAAVVCTPVDSPQVCLAFDPWKSGEPDVYEFASWDRGSWDGRVPPEYMLHGLPDSL